MMFNSISNMVESKNNSAATTTTTRSNNADLKSNNSVSTKNNNADTKNNNHNVDVKHNNNADHVQNNSDSKTNVDAPPQRDGSGNPLSPHRAAQPQHSLNGNKVYKSGPLFLSSKGIGWTSWKKRWFVLTQTSLVFFRSDPNVAPQKGGEANLTLGGIDLNSSGSVVVKPDKKLLTVMFPDGRDGRSFTLKAETTEDLNEWKSALEEALSNAPSACCPIVGKTAPPKNDKPDTTDTCSEHPKDQSLPASTVLGRPILFALEDIDGTPSFLEKALRYVEDHGVKVEGILRQAADVEAVEKRIREYEQGKVEFSAEEDAHVIGDCIKYVLRELPSSPVPASCCIALLEAYRTDRATRVNAMRAAICDTFPEPNRRLLQRMLIMMEAVAENKTVNRMSVSAVAACMAPLLLRPLLAGECNLEGQFNMGGDGSAQLMQAAAAANHAQAIVITLIEEYDNIFGEGDMLSDLYSDSEESGSEGEELSEDEIYDDEYEDGDYTSDEDSEHASTSGQSDSSRSRNKGPGSFRSCSISHKVSDDREADKKLQSSSHDRASSQVGGNARSSSQVGGNASNQSKDKAVDDEHPKDACLLIPKRNSKDDNVQVSTSKDLTDNIQRPSTTDTIRRTTSQHAGAQKKSSSVNEEVAEVNEAAKEESKRKMEAEARRKDEDFLSKKKALETRRLQLQQEVARLEEQLRKEIELRKRLETGIKISQQALFSSVSTDEKAESDVSSSNQKNNDHGVLTSPRKVKDNCEVAASSHESKDMHSSKDGNDKHRFHSSSTKQLDPKDTNSSKGKDHNFHSSSTRVPLNQRSDSTKGPKDMKKSSSNKTKRSNSKTEAAGSSSAMSKITNGLNFLKERSNQLADELQFTNKDRNKSQSGKHTKKGSIDESDTMKTKETSFQHVDSLDKGRRSDDQSKNLETGKQQHDPGPQHASSR